MASQEIVIQMLRFFLNLDKRWAKRLSKFPLFIFMVLILTLNSFSQTEYWIHPQDTDPQITTWLDSHYVCINTDIANKNVLFLFLTGSYGKPKNTQFITRSAANLGYYAINLTYPNTWTVGSFCKDSEDPDCYEKVRLEIIDGQDRTDKVDISRSNSIENRLIKLLLYLNTRHPEQNWAQFLTASNEIIWSKMIVAGFSQGGGHVGVIAKYHTVKKVIFFASPKDYSDYYDSPAAWLFDAHITPAEKYFGFNHVEDKLDKQLQNWSALGMPDSNHVINVDTSTYPYENSHRLVTNEEPRVEGKYHSCVVKDKTTPLSVDGTPLFQPVWDYLIANSDTVVNVISSEPQFPSNFHVRFYPNPFNPFTTFEFFLPKTSVVLLSVYSINGKLVNQLINRILAPGYHKVLFDGSQLCSGIYFYKIQAGKMTRAGKIILIK